MFDMLAFPVVTVDLTRLTSDLDLMEPAAVELHEMLLKVDPAYVACRILRDGTHRAQYVFIDERAARYFMKIIQNVESFEDWLSHEDNQ